jgi:5-methyltetrahydrofolate--homocysteine methyltransferase
MGSSGRWETVVMVVLDNIELEIPLDIGRDFLKKVMGAAINAPMERLLKEKTSRCIENIYPKAIYDRFEIDKVDDDLVYFQSGNIFNGTNISKILTGSKTAILYIFTLGSQVDQIIIEENQSGDTLAAIIMDTITTSLLDTLGDFVAEKIKMEGIEQSNWGVTCAYSPGQYKWTIEEQKKIFEMVDGKKIGVELNKSYLMVPFKSISGVYGFGPEDRIDKTRVACDLCPRENCIGRR